MGQIAVDIDRIADKKLWELPDKRKGQKIIFSLKCVRCYFKTSAYKLAYCKVALTWTLVVDTTHFGPLSVKATQELTTSGTNVDESHEISRLKQFCLISHFILWFQQTPSNSNAQAAYYVVSIRYGTE